MQRGRHEQPSDMGLVMLRAGMKRTVHRRAAALAACAMAACAFFWSPEAHAQTSTSDLSRVLELIQQQESRLNEQERQLHEQQRQLSEQRSLIERQRREIEAMTSISDADLSEIRGAGAELRQTLGTAVASGMIGVTVFGLLFTPAFYVMVRWIEDRFARRKGQAAAPARVDSSSPGATSRSSRME